MYKEAVKDWSQENHITLEQYLYVRNGMKGNHLSAGISPHELKCFGIDRIGKGWLKCLWKEEIPCSGCKESCC